MGLFDLTGRTALVTGSSRGLGRVIAGGLAHAGACIVLNGRRTATLEAARRELRANGMHVHASAFDVTDEAAVDAAIEAIEQRIAPLDILVNNAGVNLRGPLAHYETEQWRVQMAVNVDGVFFVSRAVGRRMIERSSGTIVNIASLMSEGGRPGTAAYAASKGAVKMLTRALAAEWGEYGIRVNAIGPGYFETDLTRPMRADPELDAWVRSRPPMKRWGRPEELIGPAVFLASDASSFVNGQVIYVDGGWLASL
jgi:gluconate 5-dehydrogenase